MDGEKQKNLDIPHVNSLAGDGIISQFGQRWYYQAVWPEMVLSVSLAGGGIISQFGRRGYYKAVWPEVVISVSLAGGGIMCQPVLSN